MHPDVMLKQMTARQLLEWQAYYELEPFGTDMEDAQAAFTRHIIALSGGLMKRGTKKAPTMEELRLLNIPKKTRKQSIEEMKDILYALAGKNNG